MALSWGLDTYTIKENENMNKMRTFAEYVAMREGLWLNDKNAVVGLSKIAPPKPPKTARPTPMPKIKPPHVPKSEGSLDQLHQSVDELGKLGIGLLPPRKEDLKRLIDKQKNQVTVPQRKAPGTTPASGHGVADLRTPTARHKGRAVDMPRNANHCPTLNTDRLQRFPRPIENPGM